MDNCIDSHASLCKFTDFSVTLTSEVIYNCGDISTLESTCIPDDVAVLEYCLQKCIST